MEYTQLSNNHNNIPQPLEKKFGIDVKFVSLTGDKNGNFGSITNESSLAQNFETGGRNLDNLFHNNQCSEILEMWINILSIKMDKVKNNLQLKSIYYFTFIRVDSKIYLTISYVDTTLFDQLTVGKTITKSVFVKGFLNDRYGNTKIYKSKKRMELRLNFTNLKKDNLLFEWDFEKYSSKFRKVRLSEIIKDKESFVDYLRESFNSIFID